jgi:capsule polysaccharide export protein KpsE/RkpR
MKKNIKDILESGEFTLVNLIHLFKEKVHLLIITMACLAAIGILIFVTTPDSYQIHTVLLIESQESSGSAGGLGSLAQLSGISLGGGSADAAFLDPALYPVIVQSKPFLEELMKTRVKSELYPDSVSLFKYMVETKPENSLSKFLKSPASIFKSPITVDSNQYDSLQSPERERFAPLEVYAMGQIASRIAVSPEGSLLNLDTEMPEADLSFQFSKKVKKLIEKYSSRYVLEKQSNQVSYLEGQYIVAEKNYKEAQNTLTKYRERNQGITLESLKAVEQNLNAEYSLKFELFRTISQELELAKVKLNSLKPIFSQIEPPYVPNRPTSPRLPMTLAFSIVLGFFLGLAVIAASYILAYFKIHQSDSN